MAIAIVFTISLVLYWRKSRETAKAIIIGVSFIVAYVSAYLPGLVSTSHGTRTMCALFSVFALFSIGSVAVYYHKTIRIILVCVLALVFTLNIYKTVSMEVNQIIGNVKENEYVERIAYEIEKYEKETGIKVNNIGICYDQSPNEEYANVSQYKRYVLKSMLSLRCNKIEVIEIPETIHTKYFLNKDWHQFDAEEQIVYDDNTAYICVF